MNALQQAFVKAGIVSKEETERAAFDKIYEQLKRLETAADFQEALAIYREMFVDHGLQGETTALLHALSWSLWKERQ